MSDTEVLQVVDEPLPKQKVFLYKVLVDEEVRFTWYVGGFGSGKTQALVMACIQLLMEYPGNRGLVARSKFIDLKATTMRSFQDFIEKNHLNAILEGDRWDTAYDSQNNLLRLKNGSELYFWGLDYRSEEQLKSLEIGFFGLDEVNEIPEKAFTILRGRLRRKCFDEKGVEIKMRRVGFIVSNPEGQNWTYHYFVNHTMRDLEGGKRIPMDEGERKKYFWIQAGSDENKYLPADYIDELNSFKGILYRRFVKGEFASFAGQIYDTLEPSVHFIPRFEVPREWYSYGINGALDHGATNPTAVGRFAIDPTSGFIILTDLYYQGQSSIERNAPKIRRIFGAKEGETLFLYADPSTFNKNQEMGQDKATCLADEYWQYRIRLVPAKNAVLPGIEVVTSYLARQDALQHIIYKTSPAPKFYIFDDLREATDEMLGYHWNPEIPDTPIKKEDHACDMIRYFLVTSPLAHAQERDEPEQHKSDIGYIRKKQLQRLSRNVKFKRTRKLYGNHGDIDSSVM